MRSLQPQQQHKQQWEHEQQQQQRKQRATTWAERKISENEKQLRNGKCARVLIGYN